MLKKTTLSDKELLEYILGSLEYTRQYLKYYNEDKFEKDLKTKDAVCYRMYKIGVATNFLSDKIKKLHPNFPWLLYNIWEYEHNPEVIWDLNRKPQKMNGNFDSLLDLFSQLEIIYFKEYFPEKLMSKQSKVKESQLTTDFKYPIKTSHSIWTVKK